MADSGGLDWPAWVQAVGSVIGIFVAIGVPAKQNRDAKIEAAAKQRLRGAADATLLLDDFFKLDSDIAKFSELADSVKYPETRITWIEFSRINSALGKINISAVAKALSRIENFDGGTAKQLAVLQVRIAEIKEKYRNIDERWKDSFETRFLVGGKMEFIDNTSINRVEIHPGELANISADVLTRMRKLADLQNEGKFDLRKHLRRP